MSKPHITIIGHVGHARSALALQMALAEMSMRDVTIIAKTDINSIAEVKRDIEEMKILPFQIKEPMPTELICLDKPAKNKHQAKHKKNLQLRHSKHNYKK